jgi:hypothetical protein
MCSTTQCHHDRHEQHENLNGFVIFAFSWQPTASEGSSEPIEIRGFEEQAPARRLVSAGARDPGVVSEIALFDQRAVAGVEHRAGPELRTEDRKSVSTCDRGASNCAMARRKKWLVN